MSYVDKLKNRLSSITTPIKDNFVEEEVQNQRYDICLTCENFIPITTTCKKCGCFMKFKTKLKSGSCPIGKW